MNSNDLDKLSDSELETIKIACELKLRERRIAQLKAMECDCDRYTCGRCHSLDLLGYRRN